MGYRTYIGSMPKREWNKIKSMTKDQLIKHYNLEVEEDENYIGMGVYNFGTCLHEFGKYTDFDPPKKSMQTFFKNKELNNCFTEEHDFKIVNEDFLKYIIESYSERIRSYYKDMIDPFLIQEEGVKGFEHHEFLNSIQREYDYPNDKIRFDFSLITDEQQTAFFKMFEHIMSMSRDWGLYTYSNAIRPYLLTGDNMVSSSKYEHQIFELVHILKTFDWKRNVMIYYGY